jgi:pimeloyl-ACP methyl ester carboxylesterase
VLLIMGIAAQLTAWPPELIDALVARGYRVVVYDHRDAGLSKKMDAAGAPDWAAIQAAKAAGKPAPVPYTLDDMARDAVGLLDALGVKAAHVVGVSMGGYIAHLLAADHAEHTLSLTSIMSDTLNPALPQPSPEVMKAFPTVERHGDPQGYADDMVRFWKAVGSPAYPTDEAVIRQRALRDFARSYYPAGFMRHAAALQAAGDQRAKLRTITVPTVVVHGDADPLVSVEGGKDTAANIPGAELRIIPGMGHDSPAPLVGRIADAIAAAASRARRARPASRP